MHSDDAIPSMPHIRAAQYVRMSTEHQQYSTENQADVIREYAAARGYEIVKTYADDGKSGLRLDGREGLKRLFADVEAGETDFEAILVYDVSRWGRFQDTDESAYYEYRLKRAGIKDPEGVRVHDLRHTYAKMFNEAVKDIQRLRGRLHHSSLNTTDIYTREVLDDPVDDWSEKVYQGMLLQA